MLIGDSVHWTTWGLGKTGCHKLCSQNLRVFVCLGPSVCKVFFPCTTRGKQPKTVLCVGASDCGPKVLSTHGSAYGLCPLFQFQTFPRTFVWRKLPFFRQWGKEGSTAHFAPPSSNQMKTCPLVYTPASTSATYHDQFVVLASIWH
jgi:hypothetical protein